MTCLNKNKIEERNKSKIATLDAFYDKFKTDMGCEDFLLEWRYPGGFMCPRCRHTHCAHIKNY